MNGLITHIQRFSVHDGPGIRTTVFLKGCPLSCQWCQNPEAMTVRPEVLFHSEYCIGCKTCIQTCAKGCFSWKGKTAFKSRNCNLCGLCVDRCPAKALHWSSKRLSSREILAEVIKDKLYYALSGGGITFSGGEPLWQIDFCHEILRQAKMEGLHTAIDTSGYVSTQDLDRVMPLVDLFLYDIKFINPRLHRKYTGVSNSLILANFQKLYTAGKKIIVRIPIIPGITDTGENIAEIECYIGMIDKEIEMLRIPFNPLIQKKYQILGRKINMNQFIPGEVKI